MITITGGAAALQIEIETDSGTRAFAKNALNINFSGNYMSIQENSKPHAILYKEVYDNVAVTGQPFPFPSPGALNTFLIANGYFFVIASGGGGGVPLAMLNLSPIVNNHTLSWANTPAGSGSITLYSLPVGTVVNSIPRWNGTDWVEANQTLIDNSDRFCSLANFAFGSYKGFAFFTTKRAIRVNAQSASLNSADFGSSNLEINDEAIPLSVPNLERSIIVRRGLTATSFGATSQHNYASLLNTTINGGIYTGNFCFHNGDTVNGNLTNTIHTGAFNQFTGSGGLYSVGASNLVNNAFVGAVIGQFHTIKNTDNFFVAACNSVTLNNFDNCAVFGMPSPYTVDQSYAMHIYSLVIGGGLRMTKQRFANAAIVTVVNEDVFVYCNFAGNAQANLPTTPRDGQIHGIRHELGIGNVLTINAGVGRTIQGALTYAVIADQENTTLIYNLATLNWKAI